MSVTTFPPQPAAGDPAWEIARLFPPQGEWDDEDYLALNELTNRFVEFTDGWVEVLDMPTRTHQRIALFLCNLINAFCAKDALGEAVIAPYPVRIRPGKFREPDVVFMLSANAGRMHEDFADGADLVIEVTSSNRRRDLTNKPKDYAEARISEYWIVDVRDKVVRILKLAGDEYQVHGEFGPGAAANSPLLNGLSVSVDTVFAAGEGSPQK